jgi:uncharacterized protein YjhX (UPF0386 family)
VTFFFYIFAQGGLINTARDHISGMGTQYWSMTGHISGTDSHISGTDSHISDTDSHTSGTDSHISGMGSHILGTASHISGASHTSGTESHTLFHILAQDGLIKTAREHSSEI